MILYFFVPFSPGKTKHKRFLEPEGIINAKLTNKWGNIEISAKKNTSISCKRSHYISIKNNQSQEFFLEFPIKARTRKKIQALINLIRGD